MFTSSCQIVDPKRLVIREYVDCEKPVEVISLRVDVKCKLRIVMRGYKYDLNLRLLDKAGVPVEQLLNTKNGLSVVECSLEPGEYFISVSTWWLMDHYNPYWGTEFELELLLFSVPDAGGEGVPRMDAKRKNSELNNSVSDWELMGQEAPVWVEKAELPLELDVNTVLLGHRFDRNRMTEQPAPMALLAMIVVDPEAWSPSLTSDLQSCREAGMIDFCVLPQRSHPRNRTFELDRLDSVQGSFDHTVIPTAYANKRDLRNECQEGEIPWLSV